MSGARPTLAGRTCELSFVNNLAHDAIEQYYTLLGVRPDGVASVVDLVVAEELPAAISRAQALLREHQSCNLVEVWRDGALVDQLMR